MCPIPLVPQQVTNDQCHRAQQNKPHTFLHDICPISPFSTSELPKPVGPTGTLTKPTCSHRKFYRTHWFQKVVWPIILVLTGSLTKPLEFFSITLVLPGNLISPTGGSTRNFVQSHSYRKYYQSHWVPLEGWSIPLVSTGSLTNPTGFYKRFDQSYWFPQEFCPILSSLDVSPILLGCTESLSNPTGFHRKSGRFNCYPQEVWPMSLDFA